MYLLGCVLLVDGNDACLDIGEFSLKLLNLTLHVVDEFIAFLRSEEHTSELQSP